MRHTVVRIKLLLQRENVAIYELLELEQAYKFHVHFSLIILVFLPSNVTITVKKFHVAEWFVVSLIAGS